MRKNQLDKLLSLKGKSIAAAKRNLCGELIGQGTYRTVYALKQDPERWVVKIEDTEKLALANMAEFLLYGEVMECDAIAKWLCPIIAMNKTGHVMIMPRAEPVTRKDLPKRVPIFLTDLKPKNWGRLDGNIVCVDYASAILSACVEVRKGECTQTKVAKWRK